MKYEITKTNEYRGQGVGLFSLIGVLFIGLKLGGVISWPWLWVLSPFWLPIFACVGILILVGIFYLIIKAL